MRIVGTPIKESELCLLHIFKNVGLFEPRFVLKPTLFLWSFTWEGHQADLQLVRKIGQWEMSSVKSFASGILQGHLVVGKFMRFLKMKPVSIWIHSQIVS